MREAQTERAMTTHIVLNVEPDPARPLFMRFEMNDDGLCPAGYTLAKAILASYPSGLIEVIILDLLSHVVLSDQYHHATEYIDPGDAPGIDRLRARLVGLAGHWDRRRKRYYAAHGLVQGPDKPAEGQAPAEGGAPNNPAE